jgi:PAS domain S-box-containing protein
MRGQLRQYAVSYGTALAAVAAALLIRLLLYPLLEDRRPYLTLFGAVAFAVWFARWRPATVAAIVGFLAAYRLLVEPYTAISIPIFMTELSGYALSTGFIIFFGEAMHRARERAQREATERRLAVASVLLEKEQFRVTLASIGDGVIVTDAQGRVRSLNAEAEKLTGWSSTKAAGQPLEAVFQIVNEDTRRPVENPVEMVLRQGAVVGLANHTVLISKNGTCIPIDDSAAPIREQNGPLLGVVLVFRNVSEQRAAQYAKARLAAIVESSGDAIISKNLQGVIQTWNGGAKRLFGYEPEEIIGKPVTLLIPEDRIFEEEEILQRLRAGKAFERLETIRLAKDGRRVSVSLNVSPVKDSEGKVVGASKIIHEITDMVAAREALVREKELLATTLASIGDGVIVTDAQGQVSFLNGEAERLTGWSNAEAAGRPLPDVFRIVNEETRQAVESPVDKVLRLGTIVGLANHTILINKEGREFAIDDSGAPIRHPGGQILGVVLVFRNSSEQRQREQRLAEQARLLDLAEDAIFVRDMQDRITFWNKGAQESYGYSASEVTGRIPHELLQTEFPEPLKKINEALHRDSRWSGELVHTRRDGTPITVNSRWALERDAHGRPVSILETNNDVSDRKQAEEALRAADSHKNQFLATLAHELRNPLAPITNSLQILRLASEDRMVVEQALATMERQVGQMVRLVDDLLDVARISRGRVELRKERVELASVVHQAAEISRPLAERLNHEVSVTLPPDPIYLHADPVRLAQVLSNLLNNACKYTEPGGRIWLSAKREGSDVLVSVKDTGIGIPPPMLTHIFEMFTQVDQTLERAHGGLGIGLTLVKQLVDLHQGRVDAFSDGPGLGSEFVVRLPLVVHEYAQEHAKTPAAPQRIIARRILIADDNRDSAQSLALLLETIGQQAHLAYDGLEALHVAEKLRPEIALLDIGMPKLNGYEVARRIREQPWGKNVVLVALTGWGQEEDQRRSRDAGFDQHIVKPAQYAALVQLLAKLQPRTA